MAKKIRVLRIINRFNLGGPTYNVTFLTAFLSDRFETKLIGGTHEKSEGDALFIPEKYDVFPELVDDLQRELNFKKDKKAYHSILKIIKEYQPDIVHTHASKAGAVGRLAAIKAGVPIIIHTFHGHVFHSYFGKAKTLFYKRVERYLAKRSSAIIAISPIQKRELVEVHKIAPSDKVRVVNLGFDLDKFQANKPFNRKRFVSDYQVREDEICIGIIGRLTAIKHHQFFLEALGHVLKTTTRKIHAFIIGDGELRNEIENSAQALTDQYPDHRITFTSWIKTVEVPLARLDMVCLTSLNEGTPVSLIEAQAANVPVVSTDVGGVSDIVKDGVTGVIVKSLSPEIYAKAMLSLTEHDTDRELFGRNGWDFVREKFHYKTLCFNIEQLYLDLLNEKNE